MTFASTPRFLAALLLLGGLSGCPLADDDDTTIEDDDDATGDADDSAGDDDDATGDDDDSAGDDDDATGDDDDSAGDDDDATGGVDGDGDGADVSIDCDDSDTANFPGNVEVCDGQDNDCDATTGFGEVVVEFGVGDLVDTIDDVFIGNILRADANTTLQELQQRMSAPAGQSLDWMFFESATIVGGYTLMSTVTTSVSAADANTMQFHSSGVINVPITAGNYYAVGVYAVGTSAYAGFSEPAEITPTPWGAVLASSAANGFSAPPPGTSVSFGSEAWVSQRITTDGEQDFDGDGVESCSGDCDDSTSLAGLGASEVICDLVDNDCDTGTPDCEGGLVVSEIFNNAFGSDTDQEWFEVYNASSVAIDLFGWMLRDDDGERVFVTLPLSIPVGGYAVLAAEDDLNFNGGVPNDQEYGGNLFFSNATDELVLVSPIGEEVDSVVYAAPPFPSQEGASMSLDIASLDAVSNDDGANWCVSFSVPYFGSSTGTPQAANPSCSLPSSGAVAGDLVVTEYLQNPAGSDSNKEWLEVYNATSATINLQGWAFEDLGTDGFVVTQPITVVAGGYSVLGKSVDVSLNGNAPVDYQYGGSMALGNSADEIVVYSPEGLLIDEVLYDGGPGFPDPNGASSSLGFGSYDALLNDAGVNWCVSTAAAFGSAGDLGSPGADNPTCP